MKKLILVLVAIVGFAYAGGIAYFSGHFLPKTMINGIDVSYKTANEADAMIKPEMPDNVTVIDMDKDSEIIDLKTIDYQIKNSSTASEVLFNQEGFKWPAAFFTSRDVKLKVQSSYNKEKLNEAILGLSVLKKQIEPVDAHLEKTENGYEIIPAVDGSTVDLNKMEAGIVKAVDENESTVDLVAIDCYKKAKVREDDPKLNEQLDAINEFIDKTITLNMIDGTEEIGRKELSDMISIKKGVKVSDKKIKKYVDKLCTKYETYQTERPFKTHSGKEIKVGGSAIDTYGFWMDREATAAIIKEAVLNVESSTIEPEWKVWSIARDEENGDIGKTYVEVSKEEQHLWFYKDGNLAYETDVVTGLPTAQRETPSGLFRILLKERNHTMTDESYSGSSHCDYWLACTWQGVGIHDAVWQSSFGGNRYLSNGSHGCINVSLEAAENIYNMVDNNVPVVIY